MPPDVICKLCGYRVAIGLHRGQLSSFSPDQLRMKKRCKRASEQDFAYDCPDLSAALLTTLEKEAQSPFSGLRAPIAADHNPAISAPDFAAIPHRTN
jgi:hypothetical protein